MTRASRFYRRTLREAPADIASPVEQLAVRAGVVQRVAGGIYALPPLGARVLRRLEAVVHGRLESIGAQEVRLPLLQPREPWERSGRLSQFEPYMLTLGGDVPWCLSPTAEESVVECLAAAGTLSHRDLPMLLYLVQPRFRRNRGARGLHRAQEYPMHEAYGFDRTAAGAAEIGDALATAYTGMLAACGVDAVVHSLREAGPARPASRNFYVVGGSVNDKTLDRCAGCGTFRDELDDGGPVGSACAACGGPFVPTPVLQIAQVTQLQQRYTACLGLGLAGARGERVAPWMCGGGVGLYRALLACIDRHRDAAGLVWPAALAPFAVTVIALDDRPGTRAHGERLHARMEAAGLSVWWDDRPASAGVKLADADLLGSPIRVILGRRVIEAAAAEVVARPSGETCVVPLDDVVPAVTRLLGAPGP
jgi:prolyl-tRNA synthetase